MSDSERDDDYSNSESDSEVEINKSNLKKPIQLNEFNAVKKFGQYVEEDLDDADDDDDDDEEIIGGANDDALEEGEVKEDYNDDDDDDAVEPDDDDDDAVEPDDDDDIEIDEDGQAIEKKPKAVKPTKPKKTTQLIVVNDNDDDDDDDEYEENYLQKFDSEINKNYITEFHPECLNHNSDEVAKLSQVIRDEHNIIIDPLHKTLPFLTKFEKARILGQRAKQIETGCKPLVRVPESIIDGFIIAELELKEKKIPFIIKRPIPGGAFEYWNLKDLEIIDF
jgi:DNA-directed RNA polymerase I, II, and III subunit RPABC2